MVPGYIPEAHLAESSEGLPAQRHGWPGAAVELHVGASPHHGMLYSAPSSQQAWQEALVSLRSRLTSLDQQQRPIYDSWLGHARLGGGSPHKPAQSPVSSLWCPPMPSPLTLLRAHHSPSGEQAEYPSSFESDSVRWPKPKVSAEEKVGTPGALEMPHSDHHHHQQQQSSASIPSKPVADEFDRTDVYPMKDDGVLDCHEWNADHPTQPQQEASGDNTSVFANAYQQYIAGLKTWGIDTLSSVNAEASESA